MSDVRVPMPTPHELCAARERALPEDGRTRLIERLWHGLGHRDVRVWVERAGSMRGVRSNLVNGLPPSWTGMRRAVDWEAVAGVLRDTLAPEVWERLVREHTTWKAA